MALSLSVIIIFLLGIGVAIFAAQQREKIKAAYRQAVVKTQDISDPQLKAYVLQNLKLKDDQYKSRLFWSVGNIEKDYEEYVKTFSDHPPFPKSPVSGSTP